MGLGHMKLTFSDSGDLVSWRGSPILLNSKYPQDPVIVAEIAPWRVKLDELSKTVIGSAETLLLESRGEESNIGNRLVSAEVRCEDCDEDTLEPLEDDKVYNVVTSNYVLGGGDGYTMLEENLESRVIGELDTDVIKEVLETSSPVSAEIEGRIIIKTGSANKGGRVTTGLLTMTFIEFSLLLVMS